MKMPGFDSISRLIPFVAAPRERDGVLGQDAFRAIIERECGRSDRNSHCFSLAAFDFTGMPERGKAAGDVIRVLRPRVRSTDEVGWLTEGELGVIMPDTTAGGASRLCDYVRQKLGPVADHPICRVFTYPSDAWGPGAGGRQLWFDDIVPPQDRSPLEAKSGSSLMEAHEPCACEDSVECVDGQSGGRLERYLAVRPPLWKRALDIAGAFMMLVVFGPLMLLIAALIKVVSPGPVFFRQERVGLGGRSFPCWKFRTMHVNNDVAGHRDHVNSLIKSQKPMFKLDDARDPRIIPFGKILRYSALDELPQLFNVLRGEMSLVGPRPCIPYEFEAYDMWQKRRALALPGLTGLWQVSGKNRTTFLEMIRLDLAYMKRLSLRRDMAIALRTVPAIATQVRDAYARWSRRRGVEFAS